MPVLMTGGLDVQ